LTLAVRLFSLFPYTTLFRSSDWVIYSYMRNLCTFRFSLIFFAACSAGADDWPQWRGPQRNGISRETGLLKEWPKEGPKLSWRMADRKSTRLNSSHSQISYAV